MIDQAALQDRLQILCEKYDVPSVSVAVTVGDQTTLAAHGLLNRETGVEATTDSVYQIGSITKVYTACLIARLVERGEIDLDATVVSYLPHFVTADAASSAQVTIRHLLTHSSGIDGDHFLDTGRGDDVLEKYVATCSELEQQFPVGATMSYCNAGFNILGRVLEVVTGKTWDQVLTDELITPLGLTRTMTLPEEVLRFRSACGHVGEPGEVKLTPQWGIPRSSGPAGLIDATAEDVTVFAKAVMGGGTAADGSTWLKPETLAAMLEPQIAVADPYTLGSHWGLGWILYGSAEGRMVFGHDGATLGQNASLRIVPDREVTVAVCTNGGGSGDLTDALLREVLGQVADLELRPRLVPVEGADPGDQSLQAGTYRRASATMTFEPAEANGLTLTVRNTSHLAHLNDEPTVAQLFPVAEDTYVAKMPGAEGFLPVVFFALEDGSRFVHLGARATARTSATW